MIETHPCELCDRCPAAAEISFDSAVVRVCPSCAHEAHGEPEVLIALAELAFADADDEGRE